MSAYELDVPADWERRTQLIYTEPGGEGLDIPLATGDVGKAPRASVVVVRETTDAETAEAALEAKMEGMRNTAPGFLCHETTSVSFADGTEGADAVVTFDVDAMRMAQRHLVRLDDDRETYVVVTVEVGRMAELRGAGLEWVLSAGPG